MRRRRKRLRLVFSANPPLRLRAAIRLRHFAQGAFVLVEGFFGQKLSIPLHDELGPGLLRDQIRKAGLTIEEFVKLL
ncbi:MAG TPA: hypothetical protein VII92_00235 [Anaerolineae bacterium]